MIDLFEIRPHRRRIHLHDTRHMVTKSPRAHLRSPKTSDSSSHPLFHTASSQFTTMATNSKRQKRRDAVLSGLDVTIEGLNLAKEISSITPAKAVFGSVSVMLTMIKVGLLLRSRAAS